MACALHFLLSYKMMGDRSFDCPTEFLWPLDEMVRAKQLAWFWHTASSQVVWAVIAVYRKSNGLFRGCLCLLLDHWIFLSRRAGNKTFICSDIGQLVAALKQLFLLVDGRKFSKFSSNCFPFFYRYQKVNLHIKSILFMSLIYWVALSDWRVAEDPAFCSYTLQNFPWALSSPCYCLFLSPSPHWPSLYTVSQTP